MAALGAWLQPRWAWLALLAAAAMLAAAHGFQRFLDLTPCALCLQQRDVYWGVVVFSVAALLIMHRRKDVRRQRITAGFLGLVFLIGAAIALYHVAVEQHWVVATCDAADLNSITTMSGSGSFEVPACDQIQWSLLGVSMAGYNALISLALAGLSFLAAAARPHV